MSDTSTVTEKIYHSRVDNLRIVVNVAPGVVKEVLFAGNALLTSDPAVIEYCDSCADMPGSYIYTKQAVADPAEAAAHAHVLANAAIAHDKLIAAGQASKN